MAQTYIVDESTEVLTYKYKLKGRDGEFIPILIFHIDTPKFEMDSIYEGGRDRIRVAFDLISPYHIVWCRNPYRQYSPYPLNYTVKLQETYGPYEDDLLKVTEGSGNDIRLTATTKRGSSAFTSSTPYGYVIDTSNSYTIGHQVVIYGFVDNAGNYVRGELVIADSDKSLPGAAPIYQKSKGSMSSANFTVPTKDRWDYILSGTDDWLIKIMGKSTKDDTNDPNPGDGDSHGGGGGGTNDLGGDPIEDTGVPTIEATDSGLMTLYNPTVSELQALGRFLWSDGLDLSSFKKLFNDPFDTLLGLSIIPIAPPTSGTKKIMFGNLDSGVSAKVISHQFVPNVDMGSITLGEVYNGALDYSPFTTVSIYLPFIGYRELNVQDIMNSKIHLVYKFDVLTGGCIAELYVDHLRTGNKSSDNSKFKWGAHCGLLASFEGQCAVNIPLASQDYTNTIKAMIGAVGMTGGAAASFATGNPALGVAALAVGSANSTIQASTPTVQRSGHLSSSNAIMANLTPFLTVTRPHQCKPSKYYKLRGVPSQIYVSKLSSLTTSKHDYYLQVAEIPDIKVAGATDTEIAEIKNLLKEGVVL